MRRHAAVTHRLVVELFQEVFEDIIDTTPSQNVSLPDARVQCLGNVILVTGRNQVIDTTLACYLVLESSLCNETIVINLAPVSFFFKWTLTNISNNCHAEYDTLVKLIHMN